MDFFGIETTEETGFLYLSCEGGTKVGHELGNP
jgi:hypothetical protein